MNKLMGYLPQYYEDNIEIQNITEAQVPEVDQLWNAIEKVRNNQFITLSDSNRLRLWERLLRIRPDLTAQSLDYRREVILLRLSIKPPITYRWLENLLDERVGLNNYYINLDYSRYRLTIHIINDNLGLINEIRQFFRQMIPANLSLIFKRAVVKEVDQTHIIPIGLTKMANKHIAIPVKRSRKINQDLGEVTVIPIGLTKTANKHSAIGIQRYKKILEISIFPIGLIKTVNKHSSTGIDREDIK